MKIKNMRGLSENKAFTLIELLAVIVILAIIAIISTPIILNIINDSKESANKRSIELYGKAVENAVADYMLQNNKAAPTWEDISKDDNIKKYYRGNTVECKTIEINDDGTVYLSGCKVGDKPVEYTYGKEQVKPVSFATDEWSTIIDAVKKGNTSAYKVGDTKEVDLGELGKHTLRIANNSTPAECNTEGFSQTACGFVIEFADIITTHVINSTLTNVGGWKDSEMRKYVNETVYNSLPLEIRSNIIETYVVSGHGPTSGETNFETTDKLYLLSRKEVWGSTSYGYDTASVKTRQLDYYKSKEISTDGYSLDVNKKSGDVGQSWWSRSAYYHNDYSFYSFEPNDGVYATVDALWGVSPAFRIG